MTKKLLTFPWLFSPLSFHLVAGSYTFTTVDFPGLTTTEVTGINDSGQLVGF